MGKTSGMGERDVATIASTSEFVAKLRPEEVELQLRWSIAGDEPETDHAPIV